jgi:hypothetical protein
MVWNMPIRQRMQRPHALTHVLVTLAVGVFLPIACASEDTGGPADTHPLGGEGTNDDTIGIDDQGCDGPLGAPQDPATLPACCEAHGGSHCVDSVPPELGDFVAGCDGGGYCVPDEFIATGGVFTPATCQSLDGAEGVCLSRCIPAVAEVDGLLPQDVCADSEKCVPCVNPIDGTETGACEIKYSCEEEITDGGGGGGAPPPAECPYEGAPIIEPDTLPACPSCGGGHCVDAGLVPDELEPQLASCGGAELCVPDDFIRTAGSFVPDTCESVAGLEGRCLSTCLPDVAEQADLLPSCGLDMVCVPCFDPIEGTETGACSLSCDPGPSGGAATLPECCEGMGACVPASAVPPDQIDALGQDVCPDGQDLVCAPTELIDGTFQAQECQAFWVSFLFGDDFEQGACLPACLAAVDNFLLGQDDCPDNYKCAPCLDPLTGEPSGACDL